MDGKNAVQYILNNNIEGDFVECGIDTARQELMWIEVLKMNMQKRHIYICLILLVV